MKEFIVKENQAFRLRIKNWKCSTPNDLNAIEFVQECLKDGEVDFTSTYQFFMTDEEVKTLAKGLVDNVN
jgi:hypothetical protein